VRIGRNRGDSSEVNNGAANIDTRANMTKHFPLTLLEAIENWLNHDPALRIARAERLRSELQCVDACYRRCNVTCYRRIDFPKDATDNPRGVPLPLLDLLHSGQLAESISSWTTDPGVAMDHFEGAQADATCVIFKRQPSPSEVLVNLSELFHSEAFRNALQLGTFSAIRSWMSMENEVILEVDHLEPEDVYRWGGFSGTFEQLQLAANEAGMAPNEIAAKEAELRAKAGMQWWLSAEKSRELALRMRDVARERYGHPPSTISQPTSDLAPRLEPQG
jgi:hypothetical protein